MKNCTPLWREAHFASQNVQNTPWSDHFWKLRCRKSARRCGAKHISKSKCTKHTRFGPLLEVEMSKKCTPLWREAHFQVKMYKTHHVSDHFWKLRCRKSARRCGAKHISKSKCTKHTMYGPLLEVQMSKKCTPLWREAHFQVKMYKTHHVRTIFGGSDSRFAWQAQGIVDLVKSAAKREGFVALHYTHYTTLHYTTLHYITLHYTTFPIHYTTLHYSYNYTSLHSTTLHSTTLHCTQLHYNYTTLHYTYTTLHSTTLNTYTTYTPLHYTTLTLHYITLNDTAPQIDR